MTLSLPSLCSVACTHRKIVNDCKSTLTQHRDGKQSLICQQQLALFIKEKRKKKVWVFFVGCFSKYFEVDASGQRRHAEIYRWAVIRVRRVDERSGRIWKANEVCLCIGNQRACTLASQHCARSRLLKLPAADFTVKQVQTLESR